MYTCNETVKYAFDHLLDISDLLPHKKLFKELRDVELSIHLFNKYEDKGWPVSFDELAFIVVKTNNDAHFANFCSQYAHRGLNMQNLLIMASAEKSTFIFSYIIKTYPDQVQFDSYVLRASQKFKDNDNMFHIARIHAMKCESCSDLKANIPMFEPTEIIDMMIARHENSKNFL